MTKRGLLMAGLALCLTGSVFQSPLTAKADDFVRPSSSVAVTSPSRFADFVGTARPFIYRFPDSSVKAPKISIKVMPTEPLAELGALTVTPYKTNYPVLGANTIELYYPTAYINAGTDIELFGEFVIAVGSPTGSATVAFAVRDSNGAVLASVSFPAAQFGIGDYYAVSGEIAALNYSGPATITFAFSYTTGTTIYQELTEPVYFG